MSTSGWLLHCCPCCWSFVHQWLPDLHPDKLAGEFFVIDSLIIPKLYCAEKCNYKPNPLYRLIRPAEILIYSNNCHNKWINQTPENAVPLSNNSISPSSELRYKSKVVDILFVGWVNILQLWGRWLMEEILGILLWQGPFGKRYWDRARKSTLRDQGIPPSKSKYDMVYCFCSSEIQRKGMTRLTMSLKIEK